MRSIALALIALLLIWLVPARSQTLMSGCVISNNNGAQNCAPWAPKLLSGLAGTVKTVKTSAGQLGQVYCYNGQAAVTYIQIFDVASPSSVTLGTTTPVLSLGIPQTNANGSGPTFVGIGFYNGIQVAATTTATGATGASMDCNVTFQ